MEPEVSESYKKLTHEVALGLSKDNIKEIKFVLRDFKKRALEKVINGTDLIQLLEERDCLSVYQVDKLAHLLRTINRHDLDKKVQMFKDSAISSYLATHDYFGLNSMHVNTNYMETLEYRNICDHLKQDNLVILKGPPGTWKSQHAFKYAHYFSQEQKNDLKSLVWRVDCSTDINIYNSLSHLMNYFKIHCISSENRIEESIEMMIMSTVATLESECYKDSKHLFILLGIICTTLPKEIINTILKHLKPHENILVILTVNESLSEDFENNVIEMHGMTEEEAIAFLDVPDSMAAKNVAKILSFSPAGLVYARTYMHQTKISIEHYLKRFENITSIEDQENSTTKACQLLIDRADEKLKKQKIKLLQYLPYFNTDNIPVFLLKSLLPRNLSDNEKSSLINTFLKILTSYSLIAISGQDDSRVIAAHSYTLMILKSSKTKDERLAHMETLLDYFVSYMDLDARLLEVIHRNVLLVNHAKAFLNNFEDESESQTWDQKARKCYLYAAIGITYRMYGNAELSADVYLSKAKHMIYRAALCGGELPCDRTSECPDTLNDYLSGSKAIQDRAKEIFENLLLKGKELSPNFIECFVENKYRNSRSIELLCKYGNISITDIKNNQLSGHNIDQLRIKNLIMDSKHIAETFWIELLITTLYNASKNTWLMELSKDERNNLRKRISTASTASSICFPVTSDILLEHQLSHGLTKHLEEFMKSFNINKNSKHSSVAQKIQKFCPIFSPVTHRNGILYMLRSICDKQPGLLKSAIDLLSELDSNTDGIGFTEFGVVKRIKDSSLYHYVMIDKLKMECYERLSKSDTLSEEDHLGEAVKIAEQLEKEIDNMESWKALSGIHLKIANVFKLKNTEENIQRAKYHYKKAFDREYESNNTRLTRFHLKAVVRYAECCIQFPMKAELMDVSKLLKGVKHRFRFIHEADSLFEDEISEINKCLGNLEEKADGINMSSNEDQNELRPSKYAQTDDLEDYYAMWLLEKKRDLLIADKERTETELKRISSELESRKNKIAENNLLKEN
ncbi:Hypothetical predicted protein [Mytilus galloprovincialis]|uniref:DED domain-containing protein n=1 Tax=Mytilus galloprovincialis TaxID=29158 RepID=A0A8B6FZR4_MYTGA|nr:Hypothetical predicted protein [Mytilus galloprovincialis]